MLASSAAAALAGLSPRRAPGAVASDGVSATFERVSGGQPLGLVGFTGEAGEAVGQAIGSGLEGRLYTDLTWLSPNALITPTPRFFIRTRTPAKLDCARPWSIRAHGLVERESRWSMRELEALGVRPGGTHVLECAGNARLVQFGLLSCATFAGVPVAEVLRQTRPSARARRVLIAGFDEHEGGSGNSTPGASWVFTPGQLEAAGAMLVTRMNGEPLTPDHGAPVRLLMPDWYGCTCIKWVDEIRWVGDDESATAHMREFAARTHQVGKPELAREYRPAAMDQAAMPVRVEKWQADGKVLYRIVGVTWGGARPSTKLVVRCVRRLPSEEPFYPVIECGERPPGQPWALWSTLWRPGAPGTYAIQLLVNDPAAPAHRLARGFYTRSITVD